VYRLLVWSAYRLRLAIAITKIPLLLERGKSGKERARLHAYRPLLPGSPNPAFFDRPGIAERQVTYLY
jgi:hypothetical protein